MRRITWLLFLLLIAVALLTGKTERNEGDAAAIQPPAGHPFVLPEPPEPLRATGRLAEVFEGARDATVRIESRCGNTRFGGVPIDVGSGFFISPEGTLLTAYHVVRRQSLAERSRCTLHYLAVDSEEREYRVELVGFDAQADLALMRAHVDGPVPYLDLSESPPRIGSEVVAIGNSRGELLGDRVGAVTRVGVRAGQAQFASGTVEITAALAPGDSGGPVIGPDGRAFGVVSYISFEPSVLTAEGELPFTSLFRATETPEYASYAVPIQAGSDTLLALESGLQRDVPVIGFQVAFEYDPRRGESLGRRPGVVVGVVQPNGPAAAAGLRSFQERTLLNQAGEPIGATVRGDVIVAVDGRPTPTFDRLLQIVREKEVGDWITLTVQREAGTDEIALELAAYRQIFP